MTNKKSYPLELRIMAAQLAGGINLIASQGDKPQSTDEVWYHRSYGFVTGMAICLNTAFGLDITTLNLLKNALWKAILYKDWCQAIKLFEAIRIWADGVANGSIRPGVSPCID